MELFPDGIHVRLRSRVHGTYLHADEDGVGVSLRPRRASLNAAWQVHRVLRDGGTCVLLHGAAYGRYLATSPEPAPPGHRGHRVVQGVYDAEAADDVVWKVVGAGHGEDVLLRHISYRLLRANGRYRLWHTGVTVDLYDNLSTMMHWVVEAIPPRAAPPVLPPPTHVHPGGGFIAWLHRRSEPVGEHRTIRYVRADDHGNYDDHGWAEFQYRGRSVFNLRMEVAIRVGEPPFFFFSIRMCAKAGRYGRLTPLITDLPRSEEPMDIVVLTASTPAAEELQYPNLEAP